MSAKVYVIQAKDNSGLVRFWTLHRLRTELDS